MKRSAGILLYRGGLAAVDFLHVHPGGPFWAKKDLGAWSMPKGEYDEGAGPLETARREFEEELGSPPPDGSPIALGEIKQPSGKLIVAFALEGDFDPARLSSNHFELEWPPKSGRIRSFPEVDRAAWFAEDEARKKILPGQAPFIDRLLDRLRSPATR
jgi:predicted NUDIX family NTP pyrophosphohydrolase